MGIIQWIFITLWQGTYYPWSLVGWGSLTELPTTGLGFCFYNSKWCHVSSLRCQLWRAPQHSPRPQHKGPSHRGWELIPMLNKICFSLESPQGEPQGTDAVPWAYKRSLVNARHRKKEADPPELSLVSTGAKAEHMCVSENACTLWIYEQVTLPHGYASSEVTSTSNYLHFFSWFPKFRTHHFHRI